MIRKAPDELADWACAQMRLLTSTEISQAGFSRGTLARAEEQGLIERIGLGIYCPTNVEQDYALMPLAEVGLKWPQAVVCNITAARYHDITLEPMAVVELATPTDGRIFHHAILSTGNLQIRARTWRAQRFENDIETYYVMGVPVRVTSPGRTVADVLATRLATTNGMADSCATDTLQMALTKGVSISEIAEAASRQSYATRVLPVLRAFEATARPTF